MRTVTVPCRKCGQSTRLMTLRPADPPTGYCSRCEQVDSLGRTAAQLNRPFTPPDPVTTAERWIAERNPHSPDLIAKIDAWLNRVRLDVWTFDQPTEAYDYWCAVSLALRARLPEG